MKNKFIKIITSVLFAIVSISLQAQKIEPDTLKIDKKYGAWVSPSKASHVYGLMFNFWSKDTGPYPKIYGAEFNICPVSVFAPFLISLYSLDIHKTFKLADDMKDSVDYSKFKKVNGCQIGFMNPEPTVINGLDINASGSFESVTHGVTVSVATNNHYVINGFTFAAIANSDYKCRGVQMAMFNSCIDLKGFQFGLWNKNQKRSLPFINWVFKS